MSVSEKSLEHFTSGYIEALLWSSVVHFNGEYVPAENFNISKAAEDKCKSDCIKFCNAYALQLSEVTDYGNRYSWTRAGHDFALTRNGHGSGYWDNDTMSLAISDALTEAAKSFGNVDLYLDNNNEVNV